MKDFIPGPLDEGLAELVRDIPPRRDLWPGISGRLTRAPRHKRPMVYAAAAALAAACVASASTWAILHGRPASRAPQLAPPQLAARDPGFRAPSFDEPQIPSYVAARDSLQQTFRERLALLEPATRAQIESSLAVIRQAHEDIRKALATDPASPVLEQLWQSTWHDELDLYDRVVRATQPNLTRT